MRSNLILTCVLVVNALMASAQSEEPNKPFPYSNRLSIQTGLLQDLMLNGQNIVITYTTRRWVFDWSHGNSLDFSSGDHFKNNEIYNIQKLDVNMPWTTGPSLGYRITPYFNVRAELKAHRHDVRYVGTKTSISKFNTYTIGAGAFYSWYPFKKKSGWAQGLLVEPVVRFWPNVGNSLTDNYTYNNHLTAKTESLDPYKLGLLANINIGYTFGGK